MKRPRIYVLEYRNVFAKMPQSNRSGWIKFVDFWFKPETVAKTRLCRARINLGELEPVYSDALLMRQDMKLGGWIRFMFRHPAFVKKITKDTVSLESTTYENV